MPAAPVLKVVVTHRAAARAKYGASGWSHIRAEVTKLAKADKARGITTKFFALDSSGDSHKVGATPVASAADAAATKASVDRIYAAWNPAYLLLLGGPELVAQHSLANPLWTGDPNDDPDQFIRTDLPYACDAPSSPSVSAFTGATRAVGRLPDLVGETDPDFLVELLRHAAAATPITSAVPTPVFALSTKTWKVSTQLSVGKLAGVTGTVVTVPPHDSVWTAADLGPALHLVNCHGGEFDPRWYGEATPGQFNLPVSMNAASLPGLITRGSVVAAECCYGVAHWPPAAAGGQAGVAATFLNEGASGVWGSSNTAYGPAAANEYADVICVLFLNELLAGASLGRAALTARQRFVQGQSFLDPTDLKTLGQYDLLGDPSIHPVTRPGQSAVPHGGATPPIGGLGGLPHAVRRADAGVPQGVLSRRAMLTAVGRALEATAVVSNDEPSPRAGLTRGRFEQLLGYALPAGARIRTFETTSPQSRVPKGRAARRATALAHSYRAAPPERLPVAHVAFIPAETGRRQTVVVVRDEAGGQAEVRVAVVR
jgi:hypothetical protein